MVGREIQQHRDPRVERVDLLELKAARLDDVQRVGRRVVDTCALSGRPMLPPTVTLKPAASSIRPVSAVVVDLPFVPVMAITRPRSQRDASSISPMTGTPARARRLQRPADRPARRGSARPGRRPRTSPADGRRARARRPARAAARPPARRRARSDSVTRAPRRDEQLGGGNAASRRADDRHALVHVDRQNVRRASRHRLTAASASPG